MRRRARGSRENGHGKSDDKIMTCKNCDEHDSLQAPCSGGFSRLCFCGRIISENKYYL
jgi:hypothetical protein